MFSQLLSLQLHHDWRKIVFSPDKEMVEAIAEVGGKMGQLQLGSKENEVNNM